MTKRRRVLWLAAAAVVLVVGLRFVVRWADATRRLPAHGELGIVAVQVLLLAALVTGAVVLVRRLAQTRKNR